MQNRAGEWAKRPLGELLIRIARPVKVDPRKTYQEIGIRSHCRGIFHKSPVRGSVLGDKRVFFVEPDCLVLNIVFAWEQAVAVTRCAEKGMIASHRFPMYAPSKNGMDVEFARLYFSTPRGKQDLLLASPGGAGRNRTLSQESFLKLQVPAPSIEQQRAVVERLAAWDAAIKESTILIRRKLQLKEALAQKLMSAGAKNGQSSSVWRDLSIEELCRDIGSGGTPSTKDLHLWNGRIPWITGADIGDDGVERARRHISREAVECSSTRLCEPGTLLLVTRTNVGKITLAPYLLAISQDLTALKPRPEIVDTQFLAHALSASMAQLLRFNQGTSISGITRRMLIQHRVRIPPMGIQKKISSTLSLAQREVTLLRSRLALWEKQRRGLLQSLFSADI